MTFGDGDTGELKVKHVAGVQGGCREGELVVTERGSGLWRHFLEGDKIVIPPPGSNEKRGEDIVELEWNTRISRALTSFSVSMVP